MPGHFTFQDFKKPGDLIRVEEGKDPYDIIKEYADGGLLLPWRDDLGRVWVRHIRDLTDPEFRRLAIDRICNHFGFDQSACQNFCQDQIAHYVRGLYSMTDPGLRLVT